MSYTPLVSPGTHTVALDITLFSIRDRDMSRLHRKRPSMLSEFHGKHNSHREQDRDA